MPMGSRLGVGAACTLLAAAACVPESPPAVPDLLVVAVRPEHTGEEIYALDVESGEERRLTFSGEGRNSNIPSWSPDHTRIAFASNRDDPEGRSSIYTMASDGTDVRRLTPVGSGDYVPVWSPDGEELAFMSSRDDGAGDVFVMGADGSGVRKLTGHEAMDGPAQWWSGGDSLLFTSTREGQGAVYVMARDGGPPRRIGAGRGVGLHPPDDHADQPHIVYMDIARSTEEGTSCGGMMTLDGTVLEARCGRETPAMSVEEGLKNPPCRSPDGRLVAFHAVPEGGVGYPMTSEEMDRLEVFVAEADGSSIRRLTFNDFYEGHCAW